MKQSEKDTLNAANYTIICALCAQISCFDCPIYKNTGNVKCPVETTTEFLNNVEVDE